MTGHAAPPIVTLPDEKTLREVSKPVAAVDSNVRKLWDDMLETMYKAPGIGLAAIQIGVPQRLLVIDLSKDGEEKTPLFVANPEIVWRARPRATMRKAASPSPNTTRW